MAVKYKPRPKAKKAVKEVLSKKKTSEPPEMPKEVPLWSSPNYNIRFDTQTSEIVYRVKIPAYRLRQIGV